jgi:small subunit ribosomal protein S18e
MGSIIAGDDFQHILRLLNTNVDGKTKIMYALTSIRGIGRRFSNLCCKKAEVDLRKRAGELSAEELERLMTIVSNPRAYKIPDWFLNRCEPQPLHTKWTGRNFCSSMQCGPLLPRSAQAAASVPV